ncbi:hypothetical protein H9X96_21860 [Pedobacter sp. N36a]|uniref:hypothetical protein n=1 Tax=Pedobacter sp. N36a TaxID=2767996 RepID=UPI001657489C|nr:hypothetical protein [Pedobacter sp. N36a]MBC8988405.1 hypothetical protein [Pedobacter sp. N36a]
MQKSVYDKIRTDITTKTGRDSTSIQIKYMYVVNRLNYVKQFKKDVYAEGVPMNTEILTELFGKGSDVKNILKKLEEFKFIIKVKDSKFRQNSACYLLHPTIEVENVLQVDFNELDSALINKVDAHNKSMNCFKNQLLALKNHVSLNHLGKEYLKRKYDLIQDGCNTAVEPSDFGLKAIHDGKFFAIRPDIKSRVYTNFTSLSRCHRKYIEINGGPMLMTDISNSQILLTVPLLHRYWAKKSGVGLTNLPQDVNAFQVLAESGAFYECMANCIGLKFYNADERGAFKKQIFREIWFSKNSKRMTKIKKAFKNQFPTVFKIIWELKNEKHNEFAIKLQQFEASILIDKVWKKMYKLGKIVFTLHDAIICSSVSDLELAEKFIQDEMEKYRIKPKFKREHEEFINVAA